MIDIKKGTGLYNKPGTVEYWVNVDFRFDKEMTAYNGVSPRIVIMKKEAEKSGWRIDSVGTG